MAPSRLLLLTLALLAPLQEIARAEEGQHPWKWAGVFDLDAEEAYTWSAARGDSGVYVDEEMRLAVVPLPAGSSSAEAAEAEAERLFESPPAGWGNVSSGDTLALSGAAAYRLTFDEASWLSLFHLRPSASGRYAFFAEHLPSEFENGFHFLKDEHSHDVEALAGVEDAVVSATVLVASGVGHAIGGAAVSALPGLVMIALVGPAVSRVNPAVFSLLNSFSAGVIFAAAVFLLMPEALHLAGELHDESVAAATWGVAIMCGWLVGVLSHHVGHHLQGDVHAEASSVEKEAGGGEVDVEDICVEAGGDAPRRSWAHRISATDRPIDLTVTLAVLFGDIWHNLVDGMIIGFSAKMCSTAAFWGVVGATLAHEAPQEVADFIVLMAKGGVHWGWAAFFNSVTAFPSTIVGAVIAHQADVSANWQGLLLAFGAGIYLFVAITELAPSVMTLSGGSVARASASRLLVFAVGAACIGLVLIDHAHCAPEGLAAVVDAAGHAH